MCQTLGARYFQRLEFHKKAKICLKIYPVSNNFYALKVPNE